MMTREDREYVLSHAYVPEHGVSLMEAVSGADMLLAGDCLCLRREDRLAVVGYPLSGIMAAEELAERLADMRQRFRPRHMAVMAPELPPSLRRDGTLLREDMYYTVELREAKPRPEGLRAVRKARRTMRAVHGRKMGDEHVALARSYMKARSLPDAVVRLFQAMPAFVRASEQAVVLEARDGEGTLHAWFVVDREPHAFDSYVLGCRSQGSDASGASDLLCQEMLAMAARSGKETVHLGLGVHEGLARFKRKWGGRPGPAYVEMEMAVRTPSLLGALAGMIRRGR